MASQNATQRRRTAASVIALLAALPLAAAAADYSSFGELSRLSLEGEAEEVVTPPPSEALPMRADPPASVLVPGPAADVPPAHVAEPIVIPQPAWDFWSAEFWDPWDGSVELGLSGTEGNTETFNVRFGLKARHKTAYLVRTLEITSIQKSAAGVTTANTALVDGRLEWPMPASRWNYYIHGLAEYDQFKAFDYRLSADTGLGYEFIQTEQTLLVGRAGVSASREIGGPDDHTNPEIAFGSEFRHKFNPTHAVSAKVDYYPNVTDFSDFRLNSQAGWEIAIAPAWGLSLKFSVIDRYDSTPQGARPNDLDYSTLLIWVF
jgi:putative salt-induced outer membrane protein YdiY